jgi:hypothetical protein
MKIKKTILTLTSIVLVFFLFAPIVVRSLHSCLESYSKTTGFTKSSNTPGKADTQMPFEEKEKEEGTDNAVIELPLIYILTEYISFATESVNNFPEVRVSGFYGATPLYIAKRSILI